MNPSPDVAEGIDVYVPLPFESPRQEIHYIRLPEAGRDRIFTDQHGQRLIHYAIERLESGDCVELGYVAGVTLQNMRWNVEDAEANEATPVLSEEQRELYLRPETNYSMDSEFMIETVGSLIGGATSDFEKLTRIHDHVIGSIRYVRDDQWDSAATVLSRGTGSCSEYNYVLSGLCRLAGLPTRCAGGSTNVFRDLPTTDTVFHRWTEVYLPDYGWFPVDCSRDANPIRGRRSHFGRVYTDALVWCRQAGGEDDTLGWDYRAKAHLQGEDPGIRENHRVRWFPYHEEEEFDAAISWFWGEDQDEGEDDVPPHPDLQECAILRWSHAEEDDRFRLIDALAQSGRIECLRRAAFLSEQDGLRERMLDQLCDSSELAEAFLENSDDLWVFRNWFKGVESKFSPTEDGRFEQLRNVSSSTPTSTDSSEEIWTALVADAVERLGEQVEASDDSGLAIMSVTDQTVAGFSDRGDSIHEMLTRQVAREMGCRLIDGDRLDRWMIEQGPGRGEYWILANGDVDLSPVELRPDVIVVPVCIVTEESESVLYRLDLKVLTLEGCKYVTLTSRMRRTPDEEPTEECGYLVAGGDTVLARWEHDWVSRNGFEQPLEGVRDILASADAALCNLECCVSLRGAPAEKGERCPFYYRARPEMLRCLTLAGIDIVTAANNHGGDYGPLSVVDTRQWCETAGLVCVGIGEDAAKAEEARLVQVGPVRVAVAGMDATMPYFCASEGAPGTNFAAEEETLEAFTKKIDRLARWAETRCDLLVLTIHWGPNWAREPSATRREMARIAFEHGVDLILGHSAHRLQGVEIIDGKAVVYDMGNLLFDCELKEEGRRSALFRLSLSKEGVSKIEVLPIQALNCRTARADSEESLTTLTEMSQLCDALGTRLELDEDLAGRPRGVIRIIDADAAVHGSATLDPRTIINGRIGDKSQDPKATPRVRPEQDATCVTLPLEGAELPIGIDPALLKGEIPEDAQRVGSPVALAPGVELLAYRLPESASEGGILPITTWYGITDDIDADATINDSAGVKGRTTMNGGVGIKNIERNVMIAFHLCPEGETPRRGTPWYTRHDPGDWSAPFHRMEVGDIVQDSYPCRLAGIPAGPCKAYALVIDTSRPEGERIMGSPFLLGEVEILPSEAD